MAEDSGAERCRAASWAAVRAVVEANGDKELLQAVIQGEARGDDPVLCLRDYGARVAWAAIIAKHPAAAAAVTNARALGFSPSHFVGVDDVGDAIICMSSRHPNWQVLVTADDVLHRLTS